MKQIPAALFAFGERADIFPDQKFGECVRVFGKDRFAEQFRLHIFAACFQFDIFQLVSIGIEFKKKCIFKIEDLGECFIRIFGFRFAHQLYDLCSGHAKQDLLAVDGHALFRIQNDYHDVSPSFLDEFSKLIGIFSAECLEGSRVKMVTDLLHEIVIEPEIVLHGESAAELFPCLEQVPDI